jgi:hypothetical protein
MATVNSEQSAENMEYVRRLLKQSNPGFSRHWNQLRTWWDGSWSHRKCYATSALISKPRSAG